MAKGHVDSVFLAEYREHAGNSLDCGCGLDSPSYDCDLGHALYAVATQIPWEQRKASS
jgi:hypothetical protein